MPDEEARVPIEEQIRWNLNDLYASPDDPQLQHDKALILARSKVFAERYRGGVAELSPHELRLALIEREELEAMRMRVNAYCVLSWTIDTHDPLLGKLDSDNDVFQAEVVQNLRMFERGWTGAPASIEQHLGDPALAKYRHYLWRLREARAHALPEGDEALISQLSLSGATGWQRFYREHSDLWRYALEDKHVAISEIEEVLTGQDRAAREQASNAIHETLGTNSHTSTFVYNMVLLEKVTKDRLRSYPTWLSERNLANEVKNKEVDALIAAVTERYDLVARYFRLYQHTLGYEALYDYDLYASPPLLDKPLSWDDAKTTVLSAFASFSPELAAIAQEFFERRWIDASPGDGKMAGAYGSSATSTVHPYIFLNFHGRSSDLFTLAHELGHGVHYYLAQQQGQLQYEVTDTMSELASTFCEMLVFDYLLNGEEDPVMRHALRTQKLQSVMNTVFQQVSFHCFEHEIHTARRESGELSTKQITGAWLAARRAMYGDGVTLRDEYGLRWGLVPHFLEIPGYVHTYAYGELLAWSLYATYQQQTEGFAERYLDVLRAGASASPSDLLAPLGIDLTDARTWSLGLSLIETFLDGNE